MEWARSLPFFLILLLSLSVAFAHEASAQSSDNLELSLHKNTINAIYFAVAVIAAISVYIIAAKKKIEKAKKLKTALFSIIVLVVLAVTIYTAGATIYLNTISESGGPVHWHADFEVWKCGQELDLLNPTGLSNRIGTSTFHEHNDNRIHLEGVVVKKSEITLHEFFHVIGGELNHGSMVYPTNNGAVSASDGELCNGQPGNLQVFLYRVTNPDERKNWEYTQTKLADYEDYLMAPFQSVPPGDCFIVEFGPEKNSTDKICTTYEVAMQKGEMHGG